MLKEYLDRAIANYNKRRHNSLAMSPIEFEAYVKELENDKRAPMRFFVENNLFVNTGQLELVFDC